MFEVYVYDEMGEVEQILAIVESEDEADTMADMYYDQFFGLMYRGDAGVTYEEI